MFYTKFSGHNKYKISGSTVPEYPRGYGSSGTL